MMMATKTTKGTLVNNAIFVYNNIMIICAALGAS